MGGGGGFGVGTNLIYHTVLEWPIMISMVGGKLNRTTLLEWILI